MPASGEYVFRMWGKGHAVSTSLFHGIVEALLGGGQPRFHSRTVLSSPALARARPSGENATAFTQLV